MDGPADAPVRDDADLERSLEVVLPVPSTAWSTVREPAALGDWLCSSVRFDGERATLVVEEEYGYRRMLECRLGPGDDGFLLEVARAQREWDGCDGTPVGPVAPASRWSEPQLDATRLELGRQAGVIVLRWQGFAATALDATRREGVLLRYAVDRAVERFGEGDAPICRVERALDATPTAVWASLDAGALLRPDPGTSWSTAEGAGGTVLVSVAGRRIATSWHAPGDAQPAGMLDVRIGHEPAGRARLVATLALARDVDGATAWLERTVDMLVEATMTGSGTCEFW